MSDEAYFEGRREVRTFADLHHGAGVMARMAREEERGSYYSAMSSLLLSAFTFEAYLNHLGALRLPFWEQIESIRVMDKYTVLLKNLEIEADFSCPPDQTLRALFKFRNAIAHGKSVILEDQRRLPVNADPHDFTPHAHWEEYSTAENAQRCLEDVESVVQRLHQAAGLGDYAFVHGVGISSLSLAAPNNALQSDPAEPGG